MAKIAELNHEGWQEWLEGRPAAVRAVAERYPPDRLYKMNDTGQFVTIVSYGEDGTVRVNVEPYRITDFIPLEVFGVDPNGLEECDVPAERFDYSEINTPASE
jgi:hypothetical protein